MGIYKKIALAAISFFLAFCFPHDAFCTENEWPQTRMDSGIIEKNLESREMDSVKEAVDKAFKETSISKAYNFSSEDLLSNALKGKPLENLKGLPKILLSLLGKEIKSNLVLILEMYAVMLLGAVIRAMQPLERGIPNEAAKLGINGIIVVIAAVSFGSIVSVVRTSIESMQHVASVAMPALTAMMAASGKIVSVTAIQPVMLIGVNMACQLLKTVLLPLAIMAGILFLVDSISDRFKLKTLAKLLKSCTVWLTGALTLVFSLLVTIQKLASSSVDAATLKTTKFAIVTFVPVAGKYMSEAAETILLCTSAVRNAAGILTVIGLGLVVIHPFIKVFIIMLSFRLAAAFGSPICDECISDALEDVAGCLSVIIGILGAALFVLVLLTGTLMSSSGLMS
ncbi:MAG TPA: hypothetical protein DD738_03590 [Ruminiclostridium sp.]|nr:hypothetical protein [Ruminiclostridium sp.]